MHIYWMGKGRWVGKLGYRSLGWETEMGRFRYIFEWVANFQAFSAGALVVFLGIQ